MNRVQFRFINNRLLSMLSLGFFLQACGVGIVKVEGPELPPAKKGHFPFNGDGYFQVCEPPKPAKGWGPEYTAFYQKHVSTIQSLLERDLYGAVHVQAPTGAKPYLYLLITPQRDVLYLPSLAISFYSLSVIPGYYVDVEKINIQFSMRDANGEIIQGSYDYEYRNHNFIWLPLLVYPDVIESFFLGERGSYINEEKKTKGLEMVLNRFLLDLSERLHQQPKETRSGVSLQELKCPHK